MSTQVPRLFAGFVDDAAVFPPGNATLAAAVVGHRQHRAAGYAELVGPLLLPPAALAELPALLGPDERIDVGVVGDLAGLARLHATLGELDPRIRVRQVEAAVARRGEDPQPGLAELLARPWSAEGIEVYAEIPLAWGLHGALDTVAEHRAAGTRVAAKFRTGGLAAELFPTPVELAAVISACRDRELPFKLTAGLHHAVRDTDPVTGFARHGFLNVLLATVAAVGGADVAEVAELLGLTDALTLVEGARARRAQERPLWTAFGSCSVVEPLAELTRFGLISRGTVA